MVMQDKSVLIFQYANLQPEFLGNTCFAFADPFGVYSGVAPN
jgi:hypothetical protein